MLDEIALDKTVRVYASGLTCCSACAPKDMSVAEVEKAVNRVNPTGIKSRWTKSPDHFRTGEANPVSCNDSPDRVHYLLEC